MEPGPFDDLLTSLRVIKGLLQGDPNVEEQERALDWVEKMEEKYVKKPPKLVRNRPGPPAS